MRWIPGKKNRPTDILLLHEHMTPFDNDRGKRKSIWLENFMEGSFRKRNKGKKNTVARLGSTENS